MPYAVQPVSTCDAPGLAEAMMSAFWQDQHWRILWVNMTLEQIISDCIERLPWSLIRDRSVKRHLKVVDTDSREIVGYSRYILPEKYAGIWPDAQTAEPSFDEQADYERRWKGVTDSGRIRGMDYAIAAEFGNPLSKVEQEILKEKGPCFEAVDYMTTHPAHQGRGVASMMLKEALEHVDEAGLKSIVMASPAGQRLYEKHGFQLIRTFSQDDSKYGATEPFIHSWLIREPFPNSNAKN
ncbi:hypothetical protein ACMFMG_012074 [Clarireedia jacksonii]